jgi:hypothetical protein
MAKSCNKRKQVTLKVTFPDGSKLTSKIISLARGLDVDFDKLVKKRGGAIIVLQCDKVVLSEVVEE